MESSAGGTLIEIASHLSYKSLPDLNIYKANQLVEIINPQKSNIVNWLSLQTSKYGSS